ncbi:methylamine utilization protein MauJ, partial [Paracoccus sp. PXZ]
ARWRCTPFRPSAMAPDFGAQAPLVPDLLPLAELFQRARNAPDAASRMLAAYAVLCGLRGRPAANDFRVTQEMLIHAGAMEHQAGLQG